MNLNRRLDDHDRRLRLPLGAMIVTIVVASLAVPTLVDAFGTGADSLAPLAPPTDLESSPVAAPTNSDAPSATTESATSLPSTSRPSTTLLSTSRPSTSTSAVPAASNPSADPTSGSEPTVAVQSIQLVPPMRDVIVQVAGRDIASDSDGLVQVPVADVGAEFVFVGIRAEPSLIEVSLDAWSDGSSATRRSLADVDGPVAAIAMVVSNRVTVGATPSLPIGSTVVFDSDIDSITLIVGTRTWVPAAHGVRTGDGFSEQDLTYEPRSSTVDGVESPLTGEALTPTPEAVWVVPATDA